MCYVHGHECEKVAKHNRNHELSYLSHCGHIVNVELHFRSLHSSLALFSVFLKEFLQSLPERRSHVAY